ncbi:MAG: hypothetical protein Q8L27_00470, partial [archaeon]|nr:hypothetical protein [archaeon]
MDVTQAIAKIRSSKKYKHISEEIIKQKTQEYINKNNLLNLSKNDLKDIKAKLHRIHGSFRGNEKKAFDNIQAKNYKKVLKSNRSTLERLNDYSEIYEKIFS